MGMGTPEGHPKNIYITIKYLKSEKDKKFIWNLSRPNH
jgi:hypothetical protein